MTEEVKPVKAVHQIVYGKGEIAPPDAIFVLPSNEDREELLASGAVVELDEVEAKLYEPAAAPKSKKAAPAAGDPLA